MTDLTLYRAVIEPLVPCHRLAVQAETTHSSCSTGRAGGRKDRCLTRDGVEHCIVVVAHPGDHNHVMPRGGKESFDEGVIEAITLEAIGALRVGCAVNLKVFVLVNVGAAEQVGYRLAYCWQICSSLKAPKYSLRLLSPYL